MINLMEHIDYFYEPIPTIDGQHKYYIWLIDEVWNIIDQGEVILKTRSSKETLDLMKKLGCDLEQFQVLMQGCIAVEAVVHINALKLCEDLVGRAAIEEAMKGAEEMAKSVKKAVDKIRKDKLKNERQLKVVE